MNLKNKTMTKAEKKFLIFCSELDFNGFSLKPYMMNLMDELFKKYETLIVLNDDGILNEFIKINDMVYVIYRYNGNRFVYKSRIRIDYVESWTTKKAA